jgi:hypothetical protein
MSALGPITEVARVPSILDGDLRLLLFGRHSLFEEFHLATRVVGDREDLVELDLRLHAVALYNAVEPRSAVERLGVLDALPLIHASRPAAFAPDEVLAYQPLHLAEAGRDLVKVLATRGVVDLRRQLVSYGGGNHGMSSARLVLAQ